MISFIKDNTARQDSKKPLNLHKSSKSGRYSISPIPILGPNKPLSLYHRRNITSIINNISNNSLSKQSFSYAFSSFKGHNPHNLSKENQDSLIIKPFSDHDTSIFGVCDGHGQYGKEISNFIALTLPNLLKTQALSPPVLYNSIKTIENSLCKSHIDTSYSGSTLVLCCINKNILFTVNIGDSRAILIKKHYNLEVIQLTTDHKPDLPDEQSRIISSGGRVAPFNNAGPARV